jgi:8-oxo-dGTP pyrophosphatase MutT (NUDIX family)
MRTIHRTIASALIFSQDGKLLMGMKDPNNGGVYADCWHIPGGGVEEGENEIDALSRELQEEVGIEIANQKIELIDDSGTGNTTKTLQSGEEVLCEMSFHVYRIDLDLPADKVSVTLNDDLVKTEWVDVANLSSYQLTPPSITLFKKLNLLKS